MFNKNHDQNHNLEGPFFVDVHCHLHMIPTPTEQLVAEAKASHIQQIVKLIVDCLK